MLEKEHNFEDFSQSIRFDRKKRIIIEIFILPSSWHENISDSKGYPPYTDVGGVVEA